MADKAPGQPVLESKTAGNAVVADAVTKVPSGVSLHTSAEDSEFDSLLEALSVCVCEQADVLKIEHGDVHSVRSWLNGRRDMLKQLHAASHGLGVGARSDGTHVGRVCVCNVCVVCCLSCF